MSDTTISTQGWDVVIAATQGTINRGLSAAYSLGLLPTDFSQTVQQSSGIISINMLLEGTFGAPTIMPLSVDSQTVQVALPITSGSISEASGGGTPIDISGTVAVVQIYLQGIETALQPEEGTTYDLMIDFSADGAIQGMNFENLPPSLSGGIESLMETAITNFLQTMTTGQTYTLATVTLGNFAADMPYLVPTLMDYAYAEDANNDDNNPFAVLMLTNGNTDKPSQLSVPAGIIPSGQDFGALISNHILMSDMILQAFATALGTSSSNFSVSGGGSAGVSETVKLNSTVTLPVDYDPEITSLSATIQDNSIHISADITMSAYGMTITYTGITVDLGVEIGAASNGSQTITFGAGAVNLPTPDVDMDWWISMIIDIIFGGLSIFLGWITPFIEKAIEIVIEDIIAALLPSGTSSGEANAFVAVLAQVDWNYSDFVEIGDVTLPTPMQITGTLPPQTNS